jgi:L-lactate dehydrogenase complex protein LldE
VRRFVRTFSAYDAVVTPSPSCAATVRRHHPLVAAEEASDEPLEAAARDLGPRVVDISEFIIDRLGMTDLGATFPHTVAFHPTCHSVRLYGIGDRPQQLLRAVQGLDLVDLGAEECCGFGGTFAVKNADTSVAMGHDKVSAITASGADVLTAADTSCLMHLGGLLSRQRSPVRVMHLAEILWAGMAV